MKRALPQWTGWLSCALFAVMALWIIVDLWRMTAADLALDMPFSEVAFNLVLRALPLLLTLFALWILFRVVTEEAATGTMTRRTRRLLFWTPRAAALLFAAFLSVFALDVFQEGAPLPETLGALFMHLIPVLVMLAGIAVAWRRAWQGAVIFTGFGLLWILRSRGVEPSVFALVAALPFALGALYWLDWIYREQMRPGLPTAGSPT